MFGVDRLHGGVSHCKRCHNIIDFPFTKIGAHVSTNNKLIKVGFRTFERLSWKEEGRICGGGRKAMLTRRERMKSCMNCRNVRGHDCDEPWTDSSCSILYYHEVAPFTICDLYDVDLDTVRFEDDGSVWGKKHSDKEYYLIIEKKSE